MPSPLISVVIPCYNHGIYLDEAISSINLAKYADLFEVILVNDGSTDASTNQKVDELAALGHIRVINQKNQGLAMARNNGIAVATGTFILPLDSDNHLVPETVIEAAGILTENPAIAVVYTDAVEFGDRVGEWVVGQLDPYKLCNMNYIDACALIRKSVFEQAVYDPQMPGMGNEDWEIWVRLLLGKYKFYYLPKPGFEYRWLQAVSMRSTSTEPRFNLNKQYIYFKHFRGMTGLFIASFFGRRGATPQKQKFRHYYLTVLLAKLGIRKMKV
ncbi:MAG: glycosyltransferase family A protein [Chitinophagaceae bacterium]